MSRIPCSLVPLLCVLSAICFQYNSPAAGAEQPQLPASWLTAWNRPGDADRPLQIVHGMHIPRPQTGESAEGVVSRYLQNLQDHGVGGMVCDMPFENYMQDQQAWKTLAATMRQCKERGMVVWLYDEQGYPSGAAGGLVLKENPDYEALELAYDANQDDPFVVRPSYEFTHANNNYYASRRYINLLNADAVNCFIRKTHDAYWAHLQPYFGSTIQAMFTDEPSLLAVSLGQIPKEGAREFPCEMRPIRPSSHCQPFPGAATCPNSTSPGTTRTC